VEDKQGYAVFQVTRKQARLRGVRRDVKTLAAARDFS
jgi:hypothetical protein